MHRSRPVAASAAATFVLCLAGAPAARAAEPTMPLSDVRAGMACTALSVVQGTEPVAFDAQIISVEGGPRPADALIIARFSGDAIAAGGIGQGFSGSPVSCPGADGVPRVIGAISQGIGQYDNFVAGITPIEAMLATPAYADAPATGTIGSEVAAKGTSAKATKGASKATGKGAATAKAKRSAAAKTKTQATTKDAATTRPWGTGRMPLTLAGPRGALAQQFKRAADRAGFPLLLGPTATRAQAPVGGLKGGDAVAATTVTGDVTAGAIGTVTYVDGPRVWAFGHPFNGTGPSRLIMERAQISTVVASPAVGEQVTYKLGSAIGPVGTVGFDGTSAIGGLLGAVPRTIPIEVAVKDGGGTQLATAKAAVVDERSVRGGSTAGLLPLASAAVAGTALQRITTQNAVGGSARTCTTIHLSGGRDPLSQCVDAVVPTPSAEGGAETGAADAAGTAVSTAIGGERFLGLVERVSVSVTYRRQADDLEIVRIEAPQDPVAGRVATVRVIVVQGSTGKRRSVPVKVRIPRAAAGERTGLVVLADPVEAGAGAAESFEELFATEEDEGSPAPKSLASLRKLFTPAGVSGLRAVALPGLSGSEALSLLTGDAEDSDLSESELAALAKRVKLVYETPTFFVEGSAAATVRPR